MSQQHASAGERRERVPDQHASIAVIGVSCRYPGARHARELWENVLGRRREFRRFLDGRLPAAEYFDPDPRAADKVYAQRAAYIDGFDFDWAKWRIPKSTFESTDIVQWLALDVATQALGDAGIRPELVPRDRAGVIVGNTLTGEQTRATSMRLRWPFVRKALVVAAHANGLPEPELGRLLETTERVFTSVFPEINEDSLQGGLSNTIAGRICNYYDLHGGGYTVDGACSSSLLAVNTAADYLSQGTWDLALAGGVDISLDPFELVGFAKATALSTGDMHVYDRRAAGFLPGEGCGFVVLKRLEDARRDGDTIYAVLRGWGVSSDGKGGMTAPNHQGQSLAIQRAYRRAGYSPHDLDFIEGHGTGTRVGDRAELQAIVHALNAFGVPRARSCGVTSFKSIVGHTKAAAGIGAFIKAVIAVNRRVVPPTAGCAEPSEIFAGAASALFPVLTGELRPPGSVLKAGVSAMGFGGINAHATIESGHPPAPTLAPTLDEQALLVSAQEAELFCLGAPTLDELGARIPALIGEAERISLGELVDLAAHMARQVHDEAPVRAALIAGSPEQLAERLNALARALRADPPTPGGVLVDQEQRFWCGNFARPPRIGFLLPGQGSQQLAMARVLVARYAWARDMVEQADRWYRARTGRALSPLIYRDLDRAPDEETVKGWERELAQTEVAQPAICLASALYAGYLARLGLVPAALAGHSLGELTAFHLAGTFDLDCLLQFATLRGQAMARPGEAGGMASLACSLDQAEALIGAVAGYATVANINAPSQIVISGDDQAVAAVVALATQQGIFARLLPVSAAFHSRKMRAAAELIGRQAPLPGQVEQLTATLCSSLDGAIIRPGLDLPQYFARQALSQVNFVRLVEQISRHCDLLIEVGPGRVLTGLVSRIAGERVACYPVASRPNQAHDLNVLLANAFARGIRINWETLYANRLVRPFVPFSAKSFIDNPCERPFAIPEPAARQSQPDHGGLAALPFAEIPGIERRKLLEYLAFRHEFLAEVIKADIRSLETIQAANHRLRAGARGEHEDHGARNGRAPVAEPADLETLLLRLAAGKTGFPAELISPDSRLLDDLNLDSIKAGELIATVAREAGMAGKIDPAQLANATLRQIADAIRAGGAGGAMQPATTLEEIVYGQIVARTGFPRQMLAPGSRLLDDLNLDSIKAGELIAAVGKLTGVAGQVDPGRFANASIAELVEMLAQVQAGAGAIAPAQQEPPQAEPDWVRNFIVTYVEREGEEHERAEASWAKARVLLLAPGEPGAWSAALGQALRSRGATIVAGQAGGATLALVVFDAPAAQVDERNALRDAVRHIQSAIGAALDSGAARIVFVQFGSGRFGRQPAGGAGLPWSVAAFARSLSLERPDLGIRVVDLDPAIGPERGAERILREAQGRAPFAAAGYDDQLRRWVPRLQLQQPARYRPRELRWTGEDVLLVTGGAKGITAECALALARRTGARFALVGSSPLPEPHAAGGAEILGTLRRFADEGWTCRYYCCDVADQQAVERLVAQVRAELGPISGVIHGAGLNRLRRVPQVSADEAIREVAPKLLGAINLCGALDGTTLKCFIALSSVIGVAGMPGNAWYAFSNEALDLLLRRFGAAHPAVMVQSVAYSVWGETGMGHRMGVVERLSGQGIGPISTAEGVARFVQLFENDPDEALVVVSGAMGSLPTWQQMWETQPPAGAGRFVEQLMRFNPGVDLAARTRLHPQRDLYLNDHNFRGSLLFPTVFGLEAMTQAATLLAGERLPVTRIADISLERPIVVDAAAGVEIEVRALAEEMDAGGNILVKAGIYTEQTGFAIPHFSATITLGGRAAAPVEPWPAGGPALPLDPLTDLYGDLLFQGPLFQRMGAIVQLDRDTVVFHSHAGAPLEGQAGAFADGADGRLVLGDPFFRDVLLQSAQLPLAPDILLPIRIKAIERFGDQPYGKRVVQARITLREGREFEAEVVARDEAGAIVERISGYRARVLEEHPGRPSAEDLAAPGVSDERRLGEALRRHCQALGVEAPALALAYAPGLHGLPKDERRRRELPLAERALRRHLGLEAQQPCPFSLAWLPSGKPTLAGAALDTPGVSISHDEHYCICVVGGGPQGCDVEIIRPRSSEEWHALLGQRQAALFEALRREGDPPDQAGSRIWSALEVARKASEHQPDDIQIRQRDGAAVLLAITSGAEQYAVLTFPIKPARGPERLVAVTVAPAAATDDEPTWAGAPTAQDADGFFFHEELGRLVYQMRFTPTFSECSNLSRTVASPTYFFWMGKLRELSMAEIGMQLVEQVATGEWGLVTNWSDLRVFGDCRAYESIWGRIWADTIENSTIRMRWEFFRHDGAGRPELLAAAAQETTWVRILGHGEVAPAPFPAYLERFLRRLVPQVAEPSRVPQPEVDIGPMIQEYAVPLPLYATSFQTTLAHANLVGNIYYANYFVWQAEVRDLFLHQVAPEHLKGIGERGEMAAVYSRMDFLRDAMPLDRIEVSLELLAVGEQGAMFQFQFFRAKPNARPEKLAVGRQQVAWVRRTARGALEPAAWPEAILRALAPQSRVVAPAL